MDCTICGRPLATGQLMCLLDVMFLTRRAERAYEAVKRGEPGLPGNIMVERSLSYLAFGHDRHGVPFVGCPFCVLVA